MSFHGQPYVHAYVNGLHVVSLVDTGAAISAISKNYIQALGLWGRHSEGGATLLGIGNHPVLSLGTVILNVTFNENSLVQFPMEFQILPESSQDCIFGHNFLNKFQISVIYGDEKYLYAMHEGFKVPIVALEKPPVSSNQLLNASVFSGIPMAGMSFGGENSKPLVNATDYHFPMNYNSHNQPGTYMEYEKTKDDADRPYVFRNNERLYPTTSQQVPNRLNPPPTPHEYNDNRNNEYHKSCEYGSNPDYNYYQDYYQYYNPSDNQHYSSYQYPSQFVNHQDFYQTDEQLVNQHNSYQPYMPSGYYQESYQHHNPAFNRQDCQDSYLSAMPPDNRQNPSVNSKRCYQKKSYNASFPSTFTKIPDDKTFRPKSRSEDAFNTSSKQSDTSKIESFSSDKKGKNEVDLTDVQKKSYNASFPSTLTNIPDDETFHTECRSKGALTSKIESFSSDKNGIDEVDLTGAQKKSYNASLPSTFSKVPDDETFHTECGSKGALTSKIEGFSSDKNGIEHLPNNKSNSTGAGPFLGGKLIENIKCEGSNIQNIRLSSSNVYDGKREGELIGCSSKEIIQNLKEVENCDVNLNFKSSGLPKENPEVNEKYVNYLMTAEEITIEPYSESQMWIKIPKITHNHWENKDIMIFPLKSLPRDCLLVAKQLVSVKTRYIPFRLINLSLSSVQLKKGEKLGEIEELTQDDISPWAEDKKSKEIPGFMMNVHSLQSESSSAVIEEILADNPWIEELNLDKLNETELSKVYPTLKEYSTVFSQGDFDIGRCTLKPAKITLNTETPINVRPYPMSPENLKQLKKEVDKLKEIKVVEKSNSSFNSPTVLVKKKNGSYRLCIDFRKINEKMVPFCHPLPTWNECTQLLSKNKYFSTLDMVAGYFQIDLEPDSRPYTAFTVGAEKLQFNALPQGIKTGVSQFQEIMNLLLGELQYEKALIYIDDILIFSQTFEEHLATLRQVLEKLKGANLKLKPGKCSLFQRQVCFLGHVIDEFGIRPDNTKIEAVQDFGRPRNKKNVKSFLGLCSYFRRFVPNFAQIADPLFNLTSDKVKFTWGEKEQASFVQLKNALIMPPVLSHPDFTKPFILYTDASLIGVAGILCQEHPDGGEVAIAYTSTRLTGAQSRYTITELELWALVFSIKKFRCFLHGAEFTAVVDHCPLRWLCNMRDPSARHFRWLMLLQEFSFQVRHRKGSAHGSVDALSRNPDWIDRSFQFKNPQAHLMKRVKVEDGDIILWKRSVCQQLGVDQLPGRPRIQLYESVNNDSLFEALSLLFTNSPDKATLFREFIHKFESQNRRYIELNRLGGEEGDTSYLRKIKRGAQGGLLEIMSIASMFRIPVVYEIKGGTRLMLGEMESKLVGGPPEGVILELRNDEFGNWIWSNHNLLSSADEKQFKLWRKPKREKISYPKGVESTDHAGGKLEVILEESGDDEDSIRNSARSVQELHVCNVGLIEECLDKINVNSEKSDTSQLICSLNVSLENTPADGLYIPTTRELIACQDKDILCKAWKTYLTTGTFKDLSKRSILKWEEGMKINSNGVLVYTPNDPFRPEEVPSDLLVLPKVLFPTVMKGIHEFLAHPGRDKTTQLVCKKYFRPGLTSLIAQYIKACNICANKSSVHSENINPIQRFPVVQEKFVTWSVDFVGPLTTSIRGNKVIFTAIDSFSRWPEAIALPNAESETLAQAFIENIVSRYGVPYQIHSDRGQNFLSELMKSIYNILKIKKTQTSAYRPCANGTVENFHKYLNNALKVNTNGAQNDWDEQLPYALLSYRVSFHRFNGDSPSYIMFGQDLILPVYSMLEADIPGHYARGLTPAGAGAEVAHRLSLARRRYLETMEVQTSKCHRVANKDRKSSNLDLGDCVLFKRPLTAKGKCKKLHKPYVGPYKIIKKLGEATFIIKEMGGRRQFQAHSDNLLKSDQVFRKEVELWASQAKEIMEELSVLSEVTPELLKNNNIIGNDAIDRPNVNNSLAPDSKDVTTEGVSSSPDGNIASTGPKPQRTPKIREKKHFTRSSVRDVNMK